MTLLSLRKWTPVSGFLLHRFAIVSDTVLKQLHCSKYGMRQLLVHVGGSRYHSSRSYVQSFSGLGLPPILHEMSLNRWLLRHFQAQGWSKVCSSPGLLVYSSKLTSKLNASYSTPWRRACLHIQPVCYETPHMSMHEKGLGMAVLEKAHVPIQRILGALTFFKGI